MSPLPSPVERHHRKRYYFGRGTHHLSRCPRPKERGADEGLSWASVFGGPLGGWQAASPWPVSPDPVLGQSLPISTGTGRSFTTPTSTGQVEWQKWLLCERELFVYPRGQMLWGGRFYPPCVERECETATD